MELATIIKSISEVGVLIVCAGLVIWQNIQSNNERKEEKSNRSKELQTIIKMLEEQNAAMLDKIINKVDTGHLISAEEDNNISKIEKELENYLTEILNETNANRVAVFRYHNGGKDYNGLSFLRMSMTNEVVRGGTALIQPQCQGLFRSMFFKLTRALDNDGTDYIIDIENIKVDDAGFYSYLKSYNIESRYSVGLRNNRGKVIGFLCIDYMKKEDGDIKVINECLEDKRVKIETLLNL